jgi:flagellar biosynthesis/type III secretory pathway chaperone
MDAYLQVITNLLEEQADNYDSLLALAQQKRKLIIAGDVDTLGRLTGREQHLISDIQRSEKKRLALMPCLARQLGLKSAKFTLTELINAIPDPQTRQSLSELRRRMRARLDDLKRANERNETLLQQNLDYIDFSMNVLRGVVAGPEEEIHGQIFFDAHG